MLSEIQVSACRTKILVHSGQDGSTVGRFSKRSGMDVHTTFCQQLAGADQCLHCTHEKATEADWLEFCALMWKHHHIDVDRGLISF